MTGKILVALALGAAAMAAHTPAHAGCRRTTDDSGPVDADGCPTGGKPLFWKEACIGWSLSQDTGSQIDVATATAVFAQSYVTWSGASCQGAPPSIQFLPQGLTTATEANYFMDGSPNENLIVFRDDEWPYGPGAQSVALTTVTFEVTTGRILDADTEVNSADFELTIIDPTTGVDVQSIFTHEVGHMLGFGHSSDPDATMTPNYEPGTTELRDLAPDDLEVLCQTYRPDGTRPTGDGVVVADPCQPIAPGGSGDSDGGGDCPTTTVASCSAAPAPASSALPASTLALFALALLGLRRRVRRSR